MTATRLLPAVRRKVCRDADARGPTVGPVTPETTVVRPLPTAGRRAYRDADSTTW